MNDHQGNSWLITGKTPLKGCVRVGGAKNAAYKLMIAALLSSDDSRILNLPDIKDVEMVQTIINELGGKAQNVGNKTMLLNGGELREHTIPLKYGKISRASTIFIPVLLAKFHKAVVPLPGGDRIGKRPIERHLDGLEKMGVKWKIEDNILNAEVTQLKGANYRFEKNTHTGTETLILAAVLAKGKTILENAAQEPEIDDLINFLNSMGAKISRLPNRVIEIEGADKLHGAIHKAMPDRNEAVSYACAALATGGDIIIENAIVNDLKSFIEKVEEIGGGVEYGDWGLRFYYKNELKATNIQTSIHPGFMTDWQPLWAILMCTANGTSQIHETVMQNRFQYINILKQMGASIEIFKPDVQDASNFYNFNWQDNKETDIHAIKIKGPTLFKGGEFEIHDLRAGATTLLAAINANGKTILHNTDQIERGYENIKQKLIQLGAKIEVMSSNGIE